MRRSIKYGLYAAVLAGVIGSTLAWVNVDKTVTVKVDGEATQVHTVAGDVKGALADGGFTVGSHDIVAPSLTSSIHNGSDIVLQRGRLLHLDVDGVDRDVWVTAPTVSQALSDLGYETADLTSVSRSKRLPLTPTDIDLRMPKTLTITQGSSVEYVTTTDATVADVFSDVGIVIGAEDIVTPPVATAITDGISIVIKRVTHAQVTTQVPVPFTTTSLPDATQVKGKTTVVTAGKNGVASTVYAVVYVDGVATGQTLVSSTVVLAPKPQVVKVGTKAPPPPAPVVAIVVDPGSAQAIAQQMLLARGMGNDQFSCLVSMWDRESGWRVNAANRSTGAYGIPQALPGSKMAVFGADWRTNPSTQIAWGLSYIVGRYGSPCGAWSYWQAHGWY